MTTDLGPGHAYGINNKGQIIGDSGIYQKGAWRSLGCGGNSVSINDRGQIAVNVAGTGGIWYQQTLIRIAGPGGEASQVTKINNRGQVVGCYTLATGATHALLWDHGIVYDLNSILTENIEMELEYAVDINDAGVIAAWGFDDFDPLGEVAGGYLLIPVVP